MAKSLSLVELEWILVSAEELGVLATRGRSLPQPHYGAALPEIENIKHPASSIIEYETDLIYRPPLFLGMFLALYRPLTPKKGRQFIMKPPLKLIALFLPLANFWPAAAQNQFESVPRNEDTEIHEIIKLSLPDVKKPCPVMTCPG